MTWHLPPGNMGLPLIGETLSFINNVFGFLETRQKRYGNIFKSSVLRRNRGGCKRLCVLIKRVRRDSGADPRNAVWPGESRPRPASWPDQTSDQRTASEAGRRWDFTPAGDERAGRRHVYGR